MFIKLLIYFGWCGNACKTCGFCNAAHTDKDLQWHPDNEPCNKFTQKQDLNMEWISVQDELPIAFVFVLMYSEKSDKIKIGSFNGERITFGDTSAHPSALDFGVTHWMPLPEPPKVT